MKNPLHGISNAIFLSVFCFLPAASAQSISVQPGEFWLSSQGLKGWQWEIDHDHDGISTRIEYFAGTDPFDPSSLPVAAIRPINDGFGVSWNESPGVRYQLLHSSDLRVWQPLGDIATSGPSPGEFIVEDLLAREFFGFEPLVPLDTDGDGLSDREEAILGTDRTMKNTDGDLLDDGVEALRSFTDPLVFNAAGASISGTVLMDDDLLGDLTNAAPIEDAVVYLDRNFNGERDPGEPFTFTDSGGDYIFVDLLPGIYEVRQELRIGETQTVPVYVTPQLPDRVPDEIINYTHSAPGAGALDTPYGYAPVDDYPGFDFIILGDRIVEIDPAVLTLPILERGDFPPIGSFARSHYLSLPDGASVTVGFEETIYDGPGADFFIGLASQGGTNPEAGNFFIGSSEANLVEIDWDTLPAQSLIPIDLADYPGVPFVRAMKLDSRTLAGPGEGGTDRGLGIVGFEGMNVLPLSTSARRIEILGPETITDQDFGRYFRDLAPTVLLSSPSESARAGQPYLLQVIATDDLGIASRILSVNGQNIPLDADFRADVTQSLPGKMEITVSATDNGGQTETKNYSLYVADENGVLPFDPNTLPGSENAGGPRIEIFTPSAGDVPTADAPITGTIVSSQGQAVWSVQYAPIALIDPENLAASDPDYIEIGSGSTNEYNSALATFPTLSLVDGIYFIRVVAQAAGGGATSFHGQVIGKNVDPSDFVPQITIHSPIPETQLDLVHDLRATLVSGRPITRWSVSVAERTKVDLSNLGADDPDWKTIATGTGTFTDQVIAQIDTTRMKNGAYVARVIAFNDLRLGRLEPVEFEVTSPAKPGRNRRVFTDAILELAGFPLQLQRNYDSFDADQSGEFGFGWSLDLANPRILETVPDTGSTIFGATPYRDGTRIYLDSPDGQRVGFTFRPKLVSASFIGTLYSANFVPDFGNPYTLKIPQGDEGFLTLRGNGEVRLSFLGFPWNPDVFILSDMAGVKYTYDQRKGFLGLEDRNGNTLVATPTGITHSSGSELLFTRDSENRITKVTAPGNIEWAYTYSPAGDLTAVTSPEGTTTLGYNPAVPHFLASVTDTFGRVGVQYEYDADGALVAIIDENGHREEHSWDPAALTGSITDRRGNVTQLIYDKRGNVTRATDALGKVTISKYEDSRFPDKETEISTENTTRTFSYNEMGLLTFTSYPGAGWSETRYNELGLPAYKYSLGGAVESFRYDDKGNLIETLDLIGYSKGQFTYTPNGQLETTSKNGVALTYRYDPVTGKRSREESTRGYFRDLTYTPDGRLAGITDATGGTVGIAYDDATRTTSISDPGGGAQVFALNPAGDLVVIDQEGATSTYTMDSEGNELTRTFDDGSSVTRIRDAEENVTSISVPGGHTNQLSYDALNRPTSFTDANGKTSTIAYDAEGRVIKRVNRNGKKIGYTYNIRNQITKETWYGPSDEIVREFTYVYGSNTGPESVTDGANSWSFGLFATESQPGQLYYAYEGQTPFSLQLAYDPSREEVPNRVRIINEIELTNFYVGNRAYSSSFSPPTLGNAGVRHRYDAMGRITSLERFDNTPGGLSVDFPPQSRTRTSYFPTGDIASIRHEKGDGSLSFPGSEMTFTRDKVGRIATRTTPLESSTFTYDTVGQLTAVDRTVGADEAYAYDIAGNPTGRTYGADNRLLTQGDFTFAYDDEGNVITRTNTVNGEIRNFEYDHRNQLTSVSNQASAIATPVEIAAYQYDYRGRVMSRTIAGQKTWLLLDRGGVFAEFADGATEINKAYFYDLTDVNNRYAEWTRTGGIKWYLTDQLGTVNGILNYDSAPAAWLEYDSFGNPLTAVPSDFGPHRFAGRFFNEATGLYENGKRNYDPNAGRFHQQDPVRYESDDYNLYRYAGNNPISATDPLGTTAAIEYGQLLKKVSGCVKTVKPTGDCVAELLEGAAQAIKGVAVKVNVLCAPKAAFKLTKGCN
ncbi:RHS repeat-associated core domain-containing protein [Verrucomicrobiaceae bacterium 227]